MSWCLTLKHIRSRSNSKTTVRLSSCVGFERVLTSVRTLFFSGRQNKIFLNATLQHVIFFELTSTFKWHAVTADPTAHDMSPIFCFHFLLMKFYFKPIKKLIIYKIHKFAVRLLHIVPVFYSNKILYAFKQTSLYIYCLLPPTGSFLLLMMSVQGDWQTVQSSGCQYCR